MTRSITLGALALALAVPAGAALMAQAASKPVKLSTGKPWGAAQTSTTIKDPAVDGQVLRVTVNKPGAKPWEAGMNSLVADKVKAGDRIAATLWLRVSTPEAGKPARITATMGQAEPPRAQYGKQDFVLTERWAPYKIEATVPTDMAAYKVALSLQLAHAQQTVDVASFSAVNLGPAS